MGWTSLSTFNLKLLSNVLTHLFLKEISEQIVGITNSYNWYKCIILKKFFQFVCKMQFVVHSFSLMVVQNSTIKLELCKTLIVVQNYQSILLTTRIYLSIIIFVLPDGC